MKTPKRTAANAVIYIVLALFAAIVLVPVLFTVTNSFMGEREILKRYGDSANVQLHIVPDEVTLQGYIDIFLLTPSYLMKFWNSVFISTVIMIGQVAIACLGGYGFSKFDFPLKNVVFYFLIILMIMPLQVTLVPNYIVLDRMGLIDSYASIILPGIFSAFGVFLLSQVFSLVPDSLIEAAKLDGANHLRILVNIMIPCCKPGVASLFILSFIDSWNMVEQPLVFLKETHRHPLSVFLANISQSKLGISFVCGVLAMIPVFLLFLHLKDSLIYGIENTKLK